MKSWNELKILVNHMTNMELQVLKDMILMEEQMRKMEVNLVEKLNFCDKCGYWSDHCKCKEEEE